MRRQAGIVFAIMALGATAPAAYAVTSTQASALSESYQRQTDDAFRKGLQTRLSWTGDFSGRLDGRIGADSLRAIRDFQARHGMKADGVISEAMLKLLVEKSDRAQSDLGVALVSDADTGADLLLPQASVTDAGRTEVGHLWRSDGRKLEVETVRIAGTGQTLSGLFDVLTTATADRSVDDIQRSEDAFSLSGEAEGRDYIMRFVGREGDLRGFSVSYESDSAARFEPYARVAAARFDPFAGEPVAPSPVAERSAPTLSEVIAGHAGDGSAERTRYAMANIEPGFGSTPNEGGFDLPPRHENDWTRQEARTGGADIESDDERSSQPGLEALSNPGFEMAGTGFVVSDDGWMVTNAHVVRGCRVVQVGEGARSTVERTVIDSENDLALIRTADDLGEPLPIAGDKPRLGEDILALGFPLRSILADSLNVTKGNVSSLRGLMNDPRYLQISAAIQPGNSGGPLIDLAGRVVGVVTAKLDAVAVADATGDIPQSINFAIQPNALTAFLKAHDIDFESSDPDAPLASVPDATAAAKDAVKPVVCMERF